MNEAEKQRLLDDDSRNLRGSAISDLGKNNINYSNRTTAVRDISNDQSALLQSPSYIPRTSASEDKVPRSDSKASIPMSPS